AGGLRKRAGDRTAVRIAARAPRGRPGSGRRTGERVSRSEPTTVGDQSPMRDRCLIGALLAAVARLLDGCAGRGPALPAVDWPANWTTRPGAAEASGWPDRPWWKSFGSAELDALIAEAEANNHDLKAAGARVDQARAEARVAGAPLFPSLFFDVQATREKK